MRLDHLLTLLLLAAAAHGETIPLELSSIDARGVQATVIADRGVPALELRENGASGGEALAILRNRNFHNGSIELDILGAPAPNAPQSARGFIGVAFRIQSDPLRFENFYLRPTNARVDDQLRRNHTTQYVSVPEWPWERLRKESPGVYESYADLAPGEWTHLRIAVHGVRASLYLGDAAQPCLLVQDLKQGDSTGGIALWIGPGTIGRFRNLTVSSDDEKPAQYGSNGAAGHYVQLADAKIYYERYGAGGTPLVLLHGGEYGYIDEFAELIREMSKTRTVIAIATRGYGRSQRGSVPLTHRQFAQDAAAVIDAVFPDKRKVDVLGFSEGAITSYILTASHPESVRRLVAIGGSLGPYGENLQSLEGPPLTPESMQQQVPDLVAARKKIMDRPELWEPLIRELEQMYRAPAWVKQEEIKSISAPTLVMAGDRDGYNRLEHMVDIYHLLPKAELAFIPGCGHVVLDCKPALVIQTVTTFLDQQP